MSRSNSPQALSVVSVTHEGNVPLTTSEITKFDGSKFGFSHERTWTSLPHALEGIFAADDVIRQFGSQVHPRVAKSIGALCELGKRHPRKTYRFRDHPGSGLKEVEGLRFGPNVVILAKASCWYLDEDGEVVIPVLQPRGTELSDRKLSIYVALVRMAYCKGEWVRARVEVIDLSQSDRDGAVVWRVIRETDLPPVTEHEVNEFLQTYLEGQLRAAEIRAARKMEEGKPKPQPKPGSTGDLFEDRDDEPR